LWNPFFSSALLSSPSTCTHGSIYSSYAMEFFFSIWVRFFNFLRFSSHWASKEHCVALLSNLSFFAERFLHEWEKVLRPTSVETDIALSTTDRQLTSNIAVAIALRKLHSINKRGCNKFFAKRCKYHLMRYAHFEIHKHFFYIIIFLTRHNILLKMLTLKFYLHDLLTYYLGCLPKISLLITENYSAHNINYRFSMMAENFET